MDNIRFADGLSSLFRSGHGLLGHLTLATLAGLSDRALDWLRERVDSEPKRAVHFGEFGRQSFDQIVSIWEVVREGQPRELRNVVHAAVGDASDPAALGPAFESLVRPLIRLGRGSVVLALHEGLPAEIAAGFAVAAGLELAACNEWDGALTMLEWAYRDGAAPNIPLYSQSELWKLAYLHGHVETVMPRLAAIHFNRDFPHMAENSRWQLLAYRIRSGRTDLTVPVLGPEDQSLPYMDAAALQIARLENIATAADVVRKLRAALPPKPIEMLVADRGMAFDFDPTAEALFAAPIRIAARDRDYEGLARLAEAPSPTLRPASAIVIDALIEEGDWRGASDVAERHDPREQSLIEGFDDVRMLDYSQLQLILAAAAARDGDDAAAQAYLARHIEAQIIVDAERAEMEREDGWDPKPNPTPGRWPAILLAGAAEGLLPRHLLVALLPVFRAPF